MSGFRIREIAADGPDATRSSVTFEEGVNIISGPSNTGKSVVVKCIKFMFGGSTIPEIAAASGYDTISMVLLDDEGKEIRVSRGIGIKDGKLKGAPSVDIVSQSVIVEDGRYSIKHNTRRSYNDVLMRLIGIDERISLIRSKERTAAAFTIKSIAHQFLLDKDGVTSEKSIIIKPGDRNYNDTTNINSLMYLLTGKHEDPTEKDTSQTKSAKKKAVITYIQSVRNVLEEKQADLNDELSSYTDFNAERMIDEVLYQISEVEGKIAEASNESREIAAQIMELSDGLEQSYVLKDRYKKLRSLYDADMKRLQFILEGEEKISGHAAETCPFCNSELETPPTDPDYLEAAKAELAETRKRIYGVCDAETDIDDDIDELSFQIKELKEERADIQELLQESYQPKLDELKRILESSERVTRLRQEIASRKEILDGLEADLGDTEALATKVEEFNAKDYFDRNLFRALSKELEAAIKACSYPDFRTARLSDITFDVVVNGKPKSMEGEGFQAYLNSIFAFTLMQFLAANGENPIRLLLLESPILSLNERVDKPATENMKSSLFSHLIQECDDSQLIIVENRLPEDVDYSSVNKIEFTGNPNNGRFGFLATVREFKDEDRAEALWQSDDEEEEEDEQED